MTKNEHFAQLVAGMVATNGTKRKISILKCQSSWLASEAIKAPLFLNVLCRLLIFVLDVHNYTRPMGQNEDGLDFFMNVLCGLHGVQTTHDQWVQMNINLIFVWMSYAVLYFSNCAFRPIGRHYLGLKSSASTFSNHLGASLVPSLVPSLLCHPFCHLLHLHGE